MLGEKLHLAIQFAVTAHYGKDRKSGGEIKLPYIVHPFAVMQMAYNARINKGSDENFLVALLLHDTIEDCSKTRQDILDIFGDSVADLVCELTFRNRDTNESVDGYREAKQQHIDGFATKSIEAVVAKVIDRLTNVKDFFTAGDSKYAVKYFNYANGLFSVFVDRKAEVIDRFGEVTFWAIRGAINEAIS